MTKLTNKLDAIRHRLTKMCFHSMGTVMHRYYQLSKPTYGVVDTDQRDMIVLSITTHHLRVNNCYPTIKSLLNQSMKPNKLILYIGEDVEAIPDTLLALCKYGLEIRHVKGDIKVHTKYFYAMKEFPEAIIITADDDIIYERKFVERLYRWHSQFPKAVIANRVHRMMKKSNALLPYKKWVFEDWSMKGVPSHKLFVTGVSGCLYPPHAIVIKSDDEENIKVFCINNDDIWLKFKELENSIPIVWTGSRGNLAVVSSREPGLARSNYEDDVNDDYIQAMERFTGIHLCDFADEVD